MKTILLTSLLLCSFITSCHEQKLPEEKVKPAIARLLKGSWFMDYPDSSSYTETWIQENDTLFSSFSYVQKGKDTLFSEKVQLKFGKQKEYIPQVANQNGGQPVIFTITSVSDSTFTAENPKHDFPTLIHYQIKKDSLIAYIEGKTKEGKLRREYFRMIRKQFMD